jgi:hypothetical protein
VGFFIEPRSHAFQNETGFRGTFADRALIALRRRKTRDKYN